MTGHFIALSSTLSSFFGEVPDRHAGVTQVFTPKRGNTTAHKRKKPVNSAIVPSNSRFIFYFHFSTTADGGALRKLSQLPCLQTRSLYRAGTDSSYVL